MRRIQVVPHGVHAQTLVEARAVRHEARKCCFKKQPKS